MLAGCSSTLLSPRHRLIVESSQFQACNFPPMSTQRLDLQCNNFTRKDGPKSQPVRPVGISIDAPGQSRVARCSLKKSVKREKKDQIWENKGKVLKKRYAEELSYDEESYTNQAKRIRGNEKSDFTNQESDNFWFHPSFNVLGLSSPQVPFSISCPSNITNTPLPPLANIPWFDSVVTENTILEGGNSGSSSTSSDSNGLVLGANRNLEEGGIRNILSPPSPIEYPEVVVSGNDREKNTHDSFELVSLLVSCVEQIDLKNISGINHFLARLGELSSPIGNSPLHRLVAHFTEALALRVARLWPNIFQITSTSPRGFDQIDEDTNTIRLLNQVSPIPKFVHFTSNEIILRAFEGKDRVHIIDFDIKQGLQWPSLFQSLASRTNPPTHVRITGIGESKQELVETGDRLSGFAYSLNLNFEFHPVVDKLEDVRLWMLHVKEKETVAINCASQMHKLLYDSTGGALHDFLGLIRSTKADLFVISEQEAEHNGARLDARICNSLKYYSAIFDSIDSSLPLESQARVKIEEMFGSVIKNIVACEGRERFERHETFARWREMMERGGFRNLGIEEREVLQGQMLLKMYSCENFSVRRRDGDRGSITLSWLDQPLYTVSAWSAVD